VTGNNYSGGFTGRDDCNVTFYDCVPDDGEIAAFPSGYETGSDWLAVSQPGCAGLAEPGFRVITVVAAFRLA